MDKILKKGVKAAVLIAVTALSIPFFLDIFLQDTIPDDNKKLEIKGSMLSGYKDGALSWQVHSDYMWSTKSRYIFHAENIRSGFIYDSNGELVIENIKAKDISINTRTSSVTVRKKCQADLIPRNQDSDKKNGLIADEKKPKKIKIIANELRYFSDAKKTLISDGIELIKDDTIIRPTGSVEIDNDDNIAYIDHGFTLESPEYRATGNQMVIYIDDDKSEMTGGVIFEKIPSKNSDPDLDEQEKNLMTQSTILSCDQATYEEVDGAKHLNVSGNIKFTQTGKKIFGNTGLYNQEDDSFELTGDVTLIVENLDWLFDQADKKKLENQDIKDSINQKTDIKSKTLYFDAENQETVLKGNVVMTQSDKTIYCNKMTLFDKTAHVECVGKVKVVKKNADTLYCEYLKINIRTEEFLAKNGVFSEYTLDNESN